MLREYGLKIVFFVYLVWYSFMIYVDITHKAIPFSVYNPLLGLSFGWLTIGTVWVFKKCMDDCNIRYLDWCITMIILRVTIIFIRDLGFDEPRYLASFTLGGMILFFIYKLIMKRSAERYFNF